MSNKFPLDSDAMGAGTIFGNHGFSWVSFPILSFVSELQLDEKFEVSSKMKTVKDNCIFYFLQSSCHVWEPLSQTVSGAKRKLFVPVVHPRVHSTESRSQTYHQVGCYPKYDSYDTRVFWRSICSPKIELEISDSQP